MSCSPGSCPSRRRFFQQAATSALGALALTGLRPDLALAETVSAITGTTPRPGERAYPVPRTDGVSFDAAAGVIIVRLAGHLYAFSTECPHRGATLEYLADEKRIYCHKHKARFGDDGAWLSGRRTRALDRFPVRLSGNQLIVSTETILEQDYDGAGYAAAQVTLP